MRSSPRRIPFALLALGALLLLASLAWAPRPDAVDGWEPGEQGEAAPRALAGRGPAVARYDVTNDTTLAVLRCGHWYCDTAVRVRGDARDALAAERIVLARVTRGDGVVPLDQPLALDEPFHPVAYAAGAEFSVRPFWPAFALAPLGALLALAGAMQLRAADRTVRVVAGAAAGGAVGAAASSLPGDAIVWGVLYVVAACALALIVMSVGAWKRARWAAAAFALATVVLFVWARPWFPSMPSL